MKSRVKLTKSLIEKTEPGEERIILRDSEVPGFEVRIYPTGKRVYYAYYRTSSGKQRRPKIGLHGALTVDRARDIARQILGKVASGIDPSWERQELRQSTKLDELWERFAMDRASRWKPATMKSQTLLYTKYIQPAMGHRPLAEIRRADVIELHESLRKSPTQANRSISLLRNILNVGIDLELITGNNPATRIRMYPEKRHEAFLDLDQLKVLIEAIQIEADAWDGKASRKREGTAEKGKRGGKGLKEAESRGISPHAAAAIRLLAYTGARRNEILFARWQMVDWKGSAIRLPDSKTGKKTLWLSSVAMDELEKLKAIATSDWIIEGRKKGQPLNNISKPWQRVREQAAKLAAEKKLPAYRIEALRVLRLHDLRHSWASFAVAMGIPLIVVGKALGHAEATTTERYAHIADELQKSASQQVGDMIRATLKASEKDGKREK